MHERVGEERRGEGTRDWHEHAKLRKHSERQYQRYKETAPPPRCTVRIGSLLSITLLYIVQKPGKIRIQNLKKNKNAGLAWNRHRRLRLSSLLFFCVFLKMIRRVFLFFVVFLQTFFSVSLFPSSPAFICTFYFYLYRGIYLHIWFPLSPYPSPSPCFCHCEKRVRHAEPRKHNHHRGYTLR